MSRKRRSPTLQKPPVPASAMAETPAPPRRAAPRWKWRTFPVFFAFATGLLVAALLNTETDNTLEGIVQIAALLLFGYGIAHLIVRNVVVAGRARTRSVGDDHNNDADHDEWEDVIVHPDDPPRPQ
jgi:hypothetical protein